MSSFSKPSTWTDKFLQLFNESVERYQAGAQKVDTLAAGWDSAFLEELGLTNQVLFDFVEDHVRKEGEPDLNTILLLVGMRRQYFHFRQMGLKSTRVVQPSELPPKEEVTGGYRWLSRITAKAQAFLRGELSDDTMYGCSGDHKFCRENNIHLFDFLCLVEATEGNLKQIVEAFDSGKVPHP